MTFEKILHDARRAVSFYVDAQGLLAAGWNTLHTKHLFQTP